MFPKCCLVSVYTAKTGSLFVAIPGSVAACRLRRRTDVFPVAASSGRLALHGHVSTTNAPVDSGGGEGEREGMWPFLSDLCQHSCVSLM